MFVDFVNALTLFKSKLERILIFLAHVTVTPNGKLLILQIIDYKRKGKYFSNCYKSVLKLML